MNYGILFVIFIIVSIMMYDLNKYLFRRKQGVALGAAIGAVGLLGSSIIGASASNDAISTNIEENEKNRKFNSAEAEKARNWQSSQWDYQFNRTANEWYNQFNAQNTQWYNQQNFLNNQWHQQQDYSNQQAYNYWLKQQDYNSPREMVGRLNSAGLNAAAAINAQQFGSTGLSAAPVGAQVAPVSSPSVISPGIPSGSSASISTSNPAQASNGASAFANIVGGVSDLVRSLAGARKDNIEAVKAEKTLSTFINQQLSNLRNTELLNQWQDMQNVFFHEKAPKELNKLGEEINVLSAKVLLMSSEQDLIDNQSITEGFKQALMGAQKDLTKEQFMQAVIFTSQYEQRLLAELDLKREQILSEKSLQSANYASAYEHTEAAKLHVEQQAYTRMETDISSLKKVAQTLENGLKANEFKASSLGLDVQEASQLFKLIQEADKLSDIKDDWNLWNKVRRVKNLLGFQMSVGVHN